MTKDQLITHDNITNPDSLILVEFYSRKPLLRRRQWYWTASHLNGNKMANGGEGYNNLADCESAFRTIARDLRYAPTMIERTA